MTNEASNKENDVKAPMPGRVLDVLVSAGEAVSAGDGLLVLEAMKMENIIKSTRQGTIKAISVMANENVEKIRFYYLTNSLNQLNVKLY